MQDRNLTLGVNFRPSVKVTKSALEAETLVWGRERRE